MLFNCEHSFSCCHILTYDIYDVLNLYIYLINYKLISVLISSNPVVCNCFRSLYLMFTIVLLGGNVYAVTASDITMVGKNLQSFMRRP